MNRAGSVDQKPLYGCTNCAEDYSWPAVDLAVYQGECWCENCWDERRWDGDLPYWSDLDDFVPEHEIQLRAEQEKVRVLREAAIAMRKDLRMRADFDSRGVRVVACGAAVWRKFREAIQATAPGREVEP